METTSFNYFETKDNNLISFDDIFGSGSGAADIPMEDLSSIFGYNPSKDGAPSHSQFNFPVSVGDISINYDLISKILKRQFLPPMDGKNDVNNLHFFDDEDVSKYVGIIGYDPRAGAGAGSEVDYLPSVEVSPWLNWWPVQGRICEQLHESFMIPDLQPHVSVGSFLSSYVSWPKDDKPVEISSLPDNNIYVDNREGIGMIYRAGAVCLYIEDNVINMQESQGIECESAPESLSLAELLRVNTVSYEPETDYKPLNPTQWYKYSSNSLNLTSIVTVSGRVVNLRGSFTRMKELLTKLSQNSGLTSEGLDKDEPKLEPERETGKFLSFLSRYAAWPKELPNNYNITDIQSEEVFLFMYNNLICMRNSHGIEYESMSPEFLPFLPLEELLRIKTIAQDTYYNPRNGLKWPGASVSSSSSSCSSLTTSISTEAGLVVKIRGSVTATKELLTRLSKTKY